MGEKAEKSQGDDDALEEETEAEEIEPREE
jgi:hypothetical protein